EKVRSNQARVSGLKDASGSMPPRVSRRAWRNADCATSGVPPSLLARPALKRLGDLDQLSPGQIARDVHQEGWRRDPEMWNDAWIDHDFCRSAVEFAAVQRDPF